MNGSDVWGSSAPYGDVLPVLKWNTYLQKNEYFPFKTVIIDDSLQNTLEKKMPSVIWKLFDFITYWYSYCTKLHGSYLFFL